MSVRAVILVVSGLICLFAQFGCKNRGALKSETKGLSRSPNAKNVAVLFSAPNNLSGPDFDVDLMAKILKDVSSDGFKAIKSYKRVNKADVLVKTMQAAREATGGSPTAHRE